MPDVDIIGPKVDDSWFGTTQLQITTTDYEGKENFEFKVTRPGCYFFIIEEEEHDDKRFEPNEQLYFVNVVVDINETGVLEVVDWRVNGKKTDEETPVEFTNLYNHDKEVVTVNIPIHKVVMGERLLDGEFSFEFYNKNEIDVSGPKVDIDAPSVEFVPEIGLMSSLPKISMPDIIIEDPEQKLNRSVINKQVYIKTEDGEGVETVEIMYDHEGEYQYFVRENIPYGDLSYKYDTREYIVTVIVVKEENGKLSASYEVSYKDPQ